MSAAAGYLPDGVYLNLDEQEYFSQDCLGSTDLNRLYRLKWGWWWQSRHNPDRREVKTEAMNYGSALHAILLEGIPEYEARFAVQPVKVPDCVETISQMKAALAEAGLSLKGTSGWSSADWAAAMADNLPTTPCWPNMMAAFQEELGDQDSPNRRRALTAQEDRMLRFMRSVAVSPDRSDNEDVRKLFDAAGDFPPLAEVSVLLTLPDGIRRRWRIDRMFPTFDLDLKSLGNWSGRPLAWATGDHIARSGYDVQRADYYQGRRVAYDHIRAGRLYGGTPEQRAWISRFPDEFPHWSWVWLFYQKPEATGRAPIIFPVWDDQDSDLHRYGQNKADKAMAFYRQAVRDFGLTQPWARVEPVHHTNLDIKPSIFLPAWIADEETHEPDAFEQENS